MGTSCLIGIKKENDKLDFSIVNYDGYLCGGVGETLVYRLTPHSEADSEKIKNKIQELIKEGYRSSLLNRDDSDFTQGNGTDIFLDQSIDDFLKYDRYDCEYAYLYDPENQKWSVASCHFPVVKNESEDLRYVFGRNYDTYEEPQYSIPYEQEKNILKDKIYDQFGKKLYPINEMLAYEVFHVYEFHKNGAIRNPDFLEFVADDKERLNKYLDDHIFDESTLNKVKNLDAKYEQERKEGLEIIKTEAKKALDLIEQNDKTNFAKLKANTVSYDLKETAKRVKKALTANGFKNISVTTKYEDVYLHSDDSFTQKQVDQIKKILAPFNNAYEDYKNALNSYNKQDFNFSQKFIDYDFGDYNKAVTFTPYNIIEDKDENNLISYSNNVKDFKEVLTKGTFSDGIDKVEETIASLQLNDMFVDLNLYQYFDEEKPSKLLLDISYGDSKHSDLQISDFGSDLIRLDDYNLQDDKLLLRDLSKIMLFEFKDEFILKPNLIKELQNYVDNYSLSEKQNENLTRDR